MTELNSIKAGDRVLVKIGRNLIECEALAVAEDGVTVRSLSTGREFTTARVEEVAGRAEPNPPAPEASEPLETSLTEMPVEAFQFTGSEVSRILETSLTEMPVEEPADEKSTDEKPEAEKTADEKPADAKTEDEKPEMVAAAGEKPEAGKPAEAPALRQPEAEAPATEEQASGEPVGADGPKPRRKLSLLNAAIEVLRAEGRPLNTHDLVKLAMERGLWTPTGCRTPEQSLYGAIFLEIKNSETPRVRKSSERGKFELA